MKHLALFSSLVATFVSLCLMTAPGAHASECEPKASCFGFESVSAALSSTQEGVPATQAGGHPDVKLSFAFKQDPSSPPNPFGLREAFAPMRDVTIETPPGLLGEPNVLAAPQQCTVQELITEGEGCPNGSQVGRTKIALYGFDELLEPLYMMVPPESSDVVARLGFIAGTVPAFINLKVRSQHQDDFGLTAELNDSPPADNVIGAETTLWGVPSARVHDDERTTPGEALAGLTVSPSRPPGSRPLSFMTNPTRCGAPLSFTVSADSWVEPHRVVTESGEFPVITGCDRVPFDPSLFVEPTSPWAAAPTGLELSFRLPAPEGVGVLESSHLKDMRIEFPPGMGINASSAAGLATCDATEVGLGTIKPSRCPDAAKLGDVEFNIPALPRRMKGAIFLRQPEPGHLFRIWVVADDLGAHVKLPGALEVNEATGQISSIVADLPQVPVREVKLLLKSGFRAPLVNPISCGTYETHWEFTPWARPEEPVGGDTPMTIDERCDANGFSPTLSGGSTNPEGGQHAPFVFALERRDGEQNPASFDVTLPKGLAASFSGIPRCEGAAATSGACPPTSLIGRVLAATGAGPTPLWVPQAGKRPTAVYLGGPYKGAPLSAIAVAPAQVGPFDLGDVVVRSAIYVDPTSAQATVKSDPLPQLIQGVPILYRVTEVVLDRPDFMLNPTNCSPESVDATVRSTRGAVAHPSAYFQASGCSRLAFKPKLSFHFFGPVHRGGHPRLKSVLKMPEGDANIASASVTLPRVEFIDSGNFQNICTRVQFAAEECPANSIYGHAMAKSPLFEETLKGPVYLRSSSRNLPDVVAVLKGPASLPIEVDLDGHVDSVDGAVRTTFEVVPDSPVSRFVLTLDGGRTKGLFENEENLCIRPHRATAKFMAQNGKKTTFHPLVVPECGKKHRRHTAK